MDLTPFSDQISSLRTIRVGPGLFILRYVSSKAGLNAPIISVATPAGSGVDIISPDDELPQLVLPGDGLVVRSSRASLINVSVKPSRKNGSCDAELVLERVSTAARRPEQLEHVKQSPSANDIEILAHVARRGDVVVHSGQWIGGPELPMAIEGLEIRWKNRPQGLDIISVATINLRGLRTLSECSIGSFQGSRGRAAPMTALMLSLVGTAAQDYSLACEALFLGLPVMNVSGKFCRLSGSTGHEPLVGLKLSIVPAAVQNVPVASALLEELPGKDFAPRAELSQDSARENSSRVRIFRAQRTQLPTARLLSH